MALLSLTGCGLPALSSADVFGLEDQPLAWVYGVVTDASGAQVVADATVQIAGSTTNSDPNGAFQLEGRFVGSADLVASKSGFEGFSQAITVRPGANHVDVRLPSLACGGCSSGMVCEVGTNTCVEAATISGDIVSACTGAVVVARVTIGGKSTCAVPGKGYWSLGGLKPGGPQALVAGKDGYEPYRADVTLKPGFNTLEKIQLTPVGGCSSMPAETACTCTMPGCQ